jgi:hypothetical protein
MSASQAQFYPRGFSRHSGNVLSLDDGFSFYPDASTVKFRCGVLEPRDGKQFSRPLATGSGEGRANGVGSPHTIHNASSCQFSSVQDLIYPKCINSGPRMNALNTPTA